MNSRYCMTRRLVWPLGLFLLLMVGSALPAMATTLRRMGLPEMVERADSVVLARALEQRVRIDSKTLYQFTVTRFEILEVAKGNLLPAAMFEVEIMGGEAPGSGYVTTVPGAPRFTDGEVVILFTSPRQDGKKNLVGFSQGAVRLAPNPDAPQLAAGVTPGASNFILRTSPPDLRLNTRQTISGQASPYHQASHPAPQLAPRPGSAASTRIAPKTRGHATASPGSTRSAVAFLARVKALATPAPRRQP